MPLDLFKVQVIRLSPKARLEDRRAIA
ncbi:hypothetical protein CCACVL1_25755 [Corchorus capsularis]|uniref:Uncharacterized protein n=1 Tax=Corchorus capsularis TaxID=210143 RepID=A0A1R3GHG0_COCAP|nr:hypothetical protein CCACVL1_25755 [Corchorus capsularis]